MRYQRASNGELLAFGDQHLLGAGGEARIYAVSTDPALVAKLWHKPTPERDRKLRVMVANPPVDPMAGQSHRAIAWPLDLLHPPGRPHQLAGFLMPRVTNMRPLGEYAHPKTRRERCPLFNYIYLHRTARNLATAVRALHDRGYVIGDLNESNVLASDTALVSIVDTDSFQVWDADSRRMYRCRVGKPEFTPPELQGKVFAQLDRDPVHDRFGLGVLIFELLMEGTHPFAGVYSGRGECPPYEQRIRAGHFPYGGDPRIPYRPKPTAPPFEVLAPGLQNTALRCFQDGHFNPQLRPEPQSWQWMLEEAEAHLVTCWANAQHAHGDHLEHCPWCARAHLLGGRDPFPAVEAVKRGDHLRPPPRPGARGRRSRTTSAGPTPAGPPVPPPIPPSAPRTPRPWLARSARPRPLLGDWNDWAWISLVAAALCGISAVPFGGRPNALTFLFGLGALISGILGEGKSRSVELDGRGRWLARVGIGVGLVALAWNILNGR